MKNCRFERAVSEYSIYSYLAAAISVDALNGVARRLRRSLLVKGLWGLGADRLFYVCVTPRFLYRDFGGGEVEVVTVNSEYMALQCFNFLASYIFPYKSKTALWPWHGPGGVRCERNAVINRGGCGD